MNDVAFIIGLQRLKKIRFLPDYLWKTSVHHPQESVDKNEVYIVKYHKLSNIHKVEASSRIFEKPQLVLHML